MSPGRLSIKTRLELETRVLAAALKISLQKGDMDGARLVHSELSKIMKPTAAQTEEAADAASHLQVQSPVQQVENGEQVEQVEHAAPAAAVQQSEPFAPPVMGDLVRSPLGTPGSTQNAQPSNASEMIAQMLEPSTQSEAVEETVSPLHVSTAFETSAPVAEINAQDQDVEGRTLDSKVDTGAVDLPTEQLETVSSVDSPWAAPPGFEQATDSPTIAQTPDLVKPELLALPPLQAPQQSQPTAADALHRSIVNTPMRASSSNMPAVRTIDESVLKASSAAPSAEESNQLRLSESLAKIEAAMLNNSQATVDSIATPATVSQPAPQVEDEAKTPDHQYQGLYRLLGVSQMSPYEEIHKNFLRKVRSFIRQINVTRRPEKLELLHNLRKIWIAHDILTDPVTRTDYDFRDLGLRGDVDTVTSPEDKQQAQLTNRTPTRIGELLQCAGLLEPAELQIACDMHKAMPEVQFGTFLVKQGFIGERDLESVLLGQKLLRAGVISVAQFQVAMELSQSRGNTIDDTLVERGYVTQEALEKAIESIDAPHVVSAAPTPQIMEATIPVEEERGQGLSAALLDLVDFEPMSESSSGNALTELLGGSSGSGSSQMTPMNMSVDHLPSVSTTGNVPMMKMERLEQPKPPEQPKPIEKPKPSLNLSQAVPSWKDQLDWDAPDMVQNDAQEESPATPVAAPVIEATEEIVSEATLEAMIETAAQTTPPPVFEHEEPILPRGINLGHAAPSWKDQLDWDSPDDTVSTNENLQPIELPSIIEDLQPVEMHSIIEDLQPVKVNAPAIDLRFVTTQEDMIPSDPNGTLNLPDRSADDEAQRLSSNHEITGEFEGYVADESERHTADAQHDQPNDVSTTSNTTESDHVSTAEYPEQSTSGHGIASEPEAAFLPGDDWVDIDPTLQMETAAHLQPITMDNLTLKQGRSSKKNKDKKKHKN